MGIDVIQKVSVAHIGVGYCKEIVIKPYLGIGTVICIYPVYGSLYSSAVGSISAPCFGVIFGIDFNNVSVFVLFAACTLYYIRFAGTSIKSSASI